MSSAYDSKLVNQIQQHFQKHHNQSQPHSVRDDGTWEWAGSGALKNLQANVYTFASEGDEDADLRELEMDEYYATALGQNYRHMASDETLVRRNPDGSLVDQKPDHLAFIEQKALEVQAFAEQREDVLEKLLMWTTCSDVLATL
ncbi:hypothetical protein B0H63DRAFT_453608 [Podospora didyma]|uniref:Uncharacterized protein n=1 Tax=Podospora didyma TaxID=330526 RepID=A0AAE0K8Q7_9PEZI|nr:hypothetical protein B0H63DRAFT_453608 [Podospora didyma]